MSDLTPALWKGPSGYRLSDGTILEQDTSVVLITAGEAESSDYWEPLRPTRAKDAVGEVDTGAPVPLPEEEAAVEAEPDPTPDPAPEGSDA